MNLTMYAFQSLGTYNCDEDFFKDIIENSSENIKLFQGFISKTYYYNTELRQGSVIYVCETREAANEAMKISRKLMEEKYPEISEFYTEFIWKVHETYNINKKD